MRLFSGAVSPIEWGAAGKPIQGEEKNGDRFIVKQFQDAVLVAVVDGLGHGEEANLAAKTAEAAIAEMSRPNLEHVMKHCNHALRPTRGAVMTAALFYPRDPVISWAGIGNVDAVLARANPAGDKSNESLIMREGTLGSLLPPVRVATLPVEKGDLLIIATDGIKSGFALPPFPSGSPGEIAVELLQKYDRGTDDALVLVARYQGPSP